MKNFVGSAVVGAAVSVSVGCSARIEPTPPVQHPIASIQELMQAVVDPSADGVWNAVSTTLTGNGELAQQPRTDTQWLEVRRDALILAEGANLLAIEGRRAGARNFPAESADALDSLQIQALVDSRRSTFNGFAAALREAALSTLPAINAKDAASLISAGGVIEEVCEACHLKFWYPNQVIPLPANAASTWHIKSGRSR